METHEYDAEADAVERAAVRIAIEANAAFAGKPRQTSSREGTLPDIPSIATAYINASRWIGA